MGDVIQHRFGGSGELSRSSDRQPDVPGSTRCSPTRSRRSTNWAASWGVKGRVLPMCPIALQIEADVAGLESDARISRVIRGQVAIATTVGKVRRVRLLPERSSGQTRQAVDAIMAADLVVLGPGSWFTSVIPHVLVPQLGRGATGRAGPHAPWCSIWRPSPARRPAFPSSVTSMCWPGTPGFTVHDIIVDASRVPGEREREQLEPHRERPQRRSRVADVARPGTPLHDPARLAAALEGVRLRGVPPCGADRSDIRRPDAERTER